MSEDPAHGATKIHASKGGGGSKWLIGAAAAVVLVGGGYFVWRSMTPQQSNSELAYNDYASDPEALRARPLDADDETTNSLAADEPTAAPASAGTRTASAPSQRAAPRATPAAATVPEETIGVTPINATVHDSDEIIVTPGRRPVWTRTPSARRLSDYYPEMALERGREGEARLNCTVEQNGALDCVRASETPGGFGSAALRVARAYRHSTTLADGSDATGTPVNLRVIFRLAEDDRRWRG
ncbi:MAG: TonB family protein [Hyphomonadaceae bacterium]